MDKTARCFLTNITLVLLAAFIRPRTIVVSLGRPLFCVYNLYTVFERCLFLHFKHAYIL